MLATPNNVRPALGRSVRASLSKNMPLVSGRQLVAQVRAYKDDAKPESAQQQEQQQEEPKAVQRAEQQPAGAMMHPGSFARLPSIFHEMEREMDALSRAFGMGGLLESDPFFRPLNLWHDVARPLSASQLPMMKLATDIEEDDKAFTLRADVPGMSKDNIKLQVLENTLTISGQRDEESRQEAGQDKPARYERRFGSFTRSFTLPKNVDVEGISANAKDGVLTVVIPKVEEQKPQAKEIPVETA